MDGSESKQQVLLVEDAETSRHLMSTLLEHYGFEVLTATNIAEARQLLASHAPNAVLLDLVLPDGNGEELLNDIRQSKRNCKVIITTGCTLERIKSVATLKPDRVLVKPINFLSLLGDLKGEA